MREGYHITDLRWIFIAYHKEEYSNRAGLLTVWREGRGVRGIPAGTARSCDVQQTNIFLRGEVLLRREVSSVCMPGTLKA